MTLFLCLSIIIKDKKRESIHFSSSFYYFFLLLDDTVLKGSVTTPRGTSTTARLHRGAILIKFSKQIYHSSRHPSKTSLKSFFSSKKKGKISLLLLQNTLQEIVIMQFIQACFVCLAVCCYCIMSQR